MKEQLEEALSRICLELFGLKESVNLTRPDNDFGDLATNIALKLAKKLEKSPKELAEQIKLKIEQTLISDVKQVTIAGPGFINLRLNNSCLVKEINADPLKIYDKQVCVVEYSDPNPFKVLHAGHLYTSIVGDGIANLVDLAGGETHRVNFGGDVGMHVAKAMWAIIRKLDGEIPEKLKDIAKTQRIDWLSSAYIEGNDAYLLDQYKQEIIAYNKKIYKIIEENDQDSDFAKIYWTCRQWSYDYFREFYKSLAINFEKYYPESETSQVGLKTVKEHIGSVYELSKGAVVFDGQKYDLHTRVFINSEGLPTYEAKEVGLIIKKWQDYHFDKSVVITGNDIIEYMKVVLKSIEQFEPELPKRTIHITHGIVKLSGGTKMSSRKGNILKATDIIDLATKACLEISTSNNHQVVLGAIKYSFLKNKIGGDIIYDPNESVSLQGNSGPYLQYAHARAKSILAKANLGVSKTLEEADFDDNERQLVIKLSQYNEIINLATAELKPHLICNYLYELAQIFNQFYENAKVINSSRQSIRLSLVAVYAQKLNSGLKLLGITALDQMPKN
jgi:arginyl-tRNA synthetase